MRSFLSLSLLTSVILSALGADATVSSSSSGMNMVRRGVPRGQRHQLFAYPPSQHQAPELKHSHFTSTSQSPSVVGKRDFPTPLQDPFYHRPTNLSQYHPGDVIRSRKITPQMDGIAGHVGDTWQIFYRTTNADGHPSSTVTTVIQPQHHHNTDGPPKMLSYHLWEDAVQRDCAPSYTILKGKDSPNVMVVGDDVPLWFRFLLMHGISVVVPDYEGPKSALFSGFTAGYAILDSARAVRNFFHWPNTAEVAMTGYSEGAHVTAWAANLAPSYAPDLNIVGVTHGGTPIDMELTLKHFDNTSFSGFTIGGLHGMMVSYKKFKKAIKRVASVEVINDLENIRKPPNCHSVLRGPDYANKPYMSMLKIRGGKNPYEWGPIRHVLDRETLWNNKSSVGVGYPTFPRMIYHGDHDDVISFEAVKAYVEQQCEHGAQIQFNVYEANAHTAPQLVIGGDLNAMRFVLEVFKIDGHAFTPVTCGFPTPSLLNYGTWLVDAVLGGNTAQAFDEIRDQIALFRRIGFGANVNKTNQAR